MKFLNIGPLVSMRQFHASDVVLPTRSDATTVKTCVPSMGAGTVAVYGDVHATAGAEVELAGERHGERGLVRIGRREVEHRGCRRW